MLTHVPLQITGLQNQVTMLLANQRTSAEGSSKLAALEGVIARLQSTLSHISAMAGKAAQENKVLLCENQQLLADRGHLQEALQQMKVRQSILCIELVAAMGVGSCKKPAESHVCQQRSSTTLAWHVKYADADGTHDMYAVQTVAAHLAVLASFRLLTGAHPGARSRPACKGHCIKPGRSRCSRCCGGS
jgi:hypothetical protein